MREIPLPPDWKPGQSLPSGYRVDWRPGNPGGPIAVPISEHFDVEDDPCEFTCVTRGLADPRMNHLIAVIPHGQWSNQVPYDLSLFQAAKQGELL